MKNETQKNVAQIFTQELQQGNSCEQTQSLSDDAITRRSQAIRLLRDEQKIFLIEELFDFVDELKAWYGIE